MNSITHNAEVPNDDTENEPRNLDTRLLDCEFTHDEVRKAINSLQNGKAACYVILFNTVLNTGQMPEAWTVGTIIPIYKEKGDPSNPSNYRGITLVSTLGKVFTKLINERLEQFSDSNRIIKDNQAGFHKKHSTTDQVFVIQRLIELYLKSPRNRLLHGLTTQKHSTRFGAMHFRLNCLRAVSRPK